MTRLRPRRRRALGALALAAALASSLLTATPAAAETYLPITGSGSTWSQNALDQWRVNVKSNYNITVNYSGTGSSAGRRDFTNRAVDFAVSEIPFQRSGAEAEAVPADGTYAYMPIVAGGTAFMYNLRIAGQRVTNLRLSGATIAKIFTGVITKWNHPEIAADNPSLALPDRDIIPVVRSDGSGTTAQFTQWMSKTQGDTWNAYCASIGRPTPCGLTSIYPVSGSMKAQNGSLGVAGYVSQNYGEGAITYVEYSYALKSGFPVAKVLNQAGYYIEPTAPAVAVALTLAQINTDPNSPDYLTQILDGVYANVDPRTYPLSSYSYMIIPTQVTGGVFSLDKGKTLSTFANYFLCEGQQQAESLGYSPLPMNLVMAGLDQVRRIPGAEGGAININACNNPTFLPGDDPSNNQLARTAAMPQACDQVGPTQCLKGTGGAAGEDTPQSNTGAGNANTGTSDGGLGPANGGAGGYDADGLPVSQAGAVAVATPQRVANSGWGVPNTLMLLAGVLIAAITVVPPLLSRRMRSQRAER